jgi:hypothetical protein
MEREGRSNRKIGDFLIRFLKIGLLTNLDLSKYPYSLKHPVSVGSFFELAENFIEHLFVFQED